MSREDAILLCSLAVTGFLSLGVIVYLQKPLHGVLRDLCGTDERARFWTAFANVVHILIPLTMVLLLRESPRSGVPATLAVLDLARWALLGLTVSVVAVALGVAIFVSPRGTTIVIDHEQADDLQRLLGKVQTLRAREILSATTHAEESA